MRILVLLIGVLAITNACSQPATESKKVKAYQADAAPHGDSLASDTVKTAYFASGCFWCVEAIYESVTGVYEAESGYCGGKLANPTYEQVCSGRTGHAETVKVTYDPRKIAFEDLVLVFFKSHDPTTLNKQGPDSGSQYRSAIFYQTDEEKRIANTLIDELLKQEVYPNITTEVSKFDLFYIAENYHQNFECRNPYNSYVQAVSLPRLERFKAAMPGLLKEEKKK